MKYLVTGGAGFIGSYLVENLIERGDQVVILENFSTGVIANLAAVKGGYKLEIGSILDKSIVDKLVSQCDFVVHLAAILGVFNIINNPLQS